MQLKLKSIYEKEWNVESADTVDNKDRNFIRTNLFIICRNEKLERYYAIDTKLPSGKWLKNIYFSNGLRNVNAIIE